MNLDILIQAKKRQHPPTEPTKRSTSPPNNQKINIEVLEKAIKRKDSTRIINIYTNAVKQLYQDNKHILSWAKTYEENTVEPLEIVQHRFKQAKRSAETEMTIDNLNNLDYQLRELESIVNVLKRVYDNLN